jgi:2-C-methyl-D-erythritol 4-phosphate cytidylyltransferase
VSALWAVLPAAGSATRMGRDRPKQFLELEGRSLLAWSIAALRDAVELVGVVAALPADCDPESLAPLFDGELVRSCCGGATRAASVAAGLAALPAQEADWVLVHDAARPCVPAADVQRLVSRVRESGVGAILARPVTDTLKRTAGDGRVTGTVSREGLWRALTPQMFRVGELRDALRASQAAGLATTDEASAMEHAGFAVDLVEGSACNIKVTFPEDLERAAWWLSRQYGGAR